MAAIQSIRLSHLTAEIAGTLQNAFSNKHFWIIAEVTNHKYYALKGHHYFDLVEKGQDGNGIVAQMNAVAWAAGNNSINQFEKTTGQKFKSDIQVLVKVSVDFHSSFGLKLTLHDIDINFTIGALEAQKQATLQRLLTECAGFIQKVGDKYITANNRILLPAVIQHIAVVTSSSSAGLQDFKHTIESNSFGYKFKMDNYFTVVQGEAKAEIFYNKLIEVFTSAIKYDVVVIIRGGGAQTDFLIFDQFILGKIVAKFPIPIITGIGHHQNETVVDLMANTATKTPTKTAELIIAHNRSFEERVLASQKAVIIKSQQVFSRNNQQLSALNSLIVNKSRNLLSSHKDHLTNSYQITVNKSKELLFHQKTNLVNIASQISGKPKTIVGNKLHDLKHIIDNLKTFNNQFLRNQTGYLNHFHAIARAMAPANILKKGFAIVKVNDKITSDAEKIKVGEDISIILTNTEIKSTVKSKNNYDGSDFNV